MEVVEAATMTTSDATTLDIPRLNIDKFDPEYPNAPTMADKINHVAYNYVALFIVALGIVGNILNLIVLTR
jgi:hypothetical protein